MREFLSYQECSVMKTGEKTAGGAQTAVKMMQPFRALERA